MKVDTRRQSINHKVSLSKWGRQKDQDPVQEERLMEREENENNTRRYPSLAVTTTLVVADAFEKRPHFVGKASLRIHYILVERNRNYHR